MGVYINMEMPKNHNYVTITIWSNGAANYGLHNRGESLIDFRNVKVVSVPEHGDLIDRDAAAEKIWDDMRFPSNLANAQFFVNELREMPTIIPADPAEEE